MEQFFHWMAMFIGAGISGSLFFFRRGGIYNPIKPINAPLTEETPETPDIAPPLPNSTPEPISPAKNEGKAPQRLYSLAYKNIGKHLSLDPSIPVSLGCADTISALLLLAQYPIPPKGIPTVTKLIKWMLVNGFVEEKKYGVGYVITGYNTTTGHIGICGKTYIISNTSFTDTKKGLVAGQFQANYRKENWGKTYPATRYFRPSVVN